MSPLPVSNNTEEAKIEKSDNTDDARAQKHNDIDRLYETMIKSFEITSKCSIE